MKSLTRLKLIYEIIPIESKMKLIYDFFYSIDAQNEREVNMKIFYGNKVILAIKIDEHKSCHHPRNVSPISQENIEVLKEMQTHSWEKYFIMRKKRIAAM